MQALSRKRSFCRSIIAVAFASFLFAGATAQVFAADTASGWSHFPAETPWQPEINWPEPKDGEVRGITSEFPLYHNNRCEYFRQGDRAEQVKQVQNSLNFLGYNAGLIDGYYGPKTAGVVKTFQKDSKIYVDGEFGPQTILALHNALQKQGGAFTCAVAETKNGGEVKNPTPQPDPGSQPPKKGYTTRTIGAGTQYATTMYIFDSGVPGPDLIVTGGIHLPIEESGTRVFEPGHPLDLEKLAVDRGRLYVVPRFNNKETPRSTIDMNRLWGSSKPSFTTGDNDFARDWFNFLKERVKNGTYGFGLDLHEGFADSLGNTIIGGGSIGASTVNYLNTLPKTRESEAHQKSASFTRAFDGAFKKLVNPVGGSWTRAAQELLDVPAAEMEVVGQTRKSAPKQDPLSLREYFIEQAIKHIGRELGMNITNK